MVISPPLKEIDIVILFETPIELVDVKRTGAKNENPCRFEIRLIAFISSFHIIALSALTIRGARATRFGDHRENRGGRRFGTSGTQTGMLASVGGSVQKQISEILIPDSSLPTPHHPDANLFNRSGHFSTQGFSVSSPLSASSSNPSPDVVKTRLCPGYHDTFFVQF